MQFFVVVFCHSEIVFLPCVDSSDIFIIMASCCRSDSGTARDPPPAFFELVRGDDSQLRLPRFRLFGVLLSVKIQENAVNILQQYKGTGASLIANHICNWMEL